MHYGTCAELEDEADRLIKESLEGVFSHKQKSDILTSWKNDYRHRHEVYVGLDPETERSTGATSGTPERHMRQGMYHRVANKGRPDLNSRDGMAANSRHRTKTSRAWDAGDTMTIFQLSGDTITLDVYAEMMSSGNR
jgi:hypothetical protein